MSLLSLDQEKISGHKDTVLIKAIRSAELLGPKGVPYWRLGPVKTRCPRGFGVWVGGGTCVGGGGRCMRAVGGGDLSLGASAIEPFPNTQTPFPLLPRPSAGVWLLLPFQANLRKGLTESDSRALLPFIQINAFCPHHFFR